MRSLRHLAWTSVAASIVLAVLTVTLLSSCGAATRSRTTLKLKSATRPARTGTRVEAAIPPGPGALVAIVIRATVLRDKKVVQRSTVAIGPPEAPTPAGRFAVTDRLIRTNPNGPYGCCILGLSAHSPHTIQGWGGGGRIAIHSTPDTASIGEAVSRGCVRVTMAEGRWLLNHIPLATPTIISS